MVLSPDLKHTIAAHTASMPLLDRVKSARHLIKVYHIPKEDWKDVAFIACVQEDRLQ